MKVSLSYGASSIQVAIPESVTVISPHETPPKVDKKGFIAGVASLLYNKAEVFGKVAIVVADKTRLCGYNYALPWLITALRQHGILDEQITFFIAYGTHRKQSDEECRSSYGEVYERFPFVHHDCTNDTMVPIGTTSRGTQPFIRKDILEAELIITFGAVSHHYFAGYGGGRKLLFPGLAAQSAIYHNHSLFLDKQANELQRNCTPGNLSANPLAQDLEEIHHLLPPYISIHGLLNSSGGVIDYFFGSTYDDFLSVCIQQDQLYRVENRDQYDFVIGSAGGFPKDINFIQSHKALHNCASFVKDKGTLILLAECRDLIGSTTFLPWIATGYKKAFAQLSKCYEGNGGTALAMMEKTKRVNIHMVTSLSKELCEKLNVEKIDIDKMTMMIKQHSGSIGVFTNGAMSV